MAKLAEIEGQAGQDYIEKQDKDFAAFKQRILELEAAVKDAKALSDSQASRLQELEAEHSSRLCVREQVPWGLGPVSFLAILFSDVLRFGSL